MNIKKLITAGIMAMVALAAFAEPVVTDVVAKQRYPWNGLVDITCKVSGINGMTNGLKFALSAVIPNSNVVTPIYHFGIVKGGTNSVDRMVRTNGYYRLFWDARADLGAEKFYSNMVVRVICGVGAHRVQLWKNGPYWADTNIGANAPWEYGYFFWWGDTIGYKREGNAWVASDGSSSDFSFAKENTPTYGKSLSELRGKGWITTDGVLAPEHDAAWVQWGGDWRMPTLEELNELNDGCDWTWTTNGVNGYVIRGRGDYASASIFLPVDSYGDGNYWSSVPASDDRNYSWELYIYSTWHGTSDMVRYRYGGRVVRPVQGFTTTASGFVSDSAPFSLDTTEGTRIARAVEIIAYSTMWDDAECVRIAVDGVTLKDAVAPASGDVLWNAANAGLGSHTLTYTTYKNGFADKVETVDFFVKDYVVTFDAKGGSLGTASPTRTVVNGTAIGTLPTPARTGYTFKGWWTAASGGTRITSATTVTGNVTYYAHWTVNTYTVTFNANGGTVGTTSVSKNYGQTIGTCPTPTRTGYTFTGWWTSVSGGTQISYSTKVTGNVTYYAHWTINQYTVTFNANGGSGSATKTQDYGTALTVPTVTRTGYMLTGWTPSVPSTMPADNATYTAQWKVNQYTATFNANGGSGGTTKTQDYGTSLTAPTVTRTGYTFTGWSPSVPSTMPAGNATYTAQWKINQYTATFNANGGSGGATKTQDYGTSLSAPSVTRTGYTFTGWSPSVPSTMPAGNTTYTAQWNVNQYTVTFNANGGSGGTTKTQDYGTTLTAPTVTRTGYTFTGWSPSVPSTMPAGNQTYTAQWQINQYTVTFNANGGTGGKTVTQNYGTAITAPTVTREWCTFTGWSPAVAATIPAQNVTYTAQWARWGDTISASKMGGKTMKQLYPSDYTRMTTVVIEEGITELPVGFFNGCDNVVNLTLPESLQEFGIDDLPSKIRASLAYDVNGFKIYGNWILDYQNRSASAVTIPEGIVGIGRGAFKEMFDLETVTMPESLRCIASGAFEDCSWIQNLQFMSGLRYVGPEAFRGCSSLLGASFADGVEIIGTNVFESCWQMKSVRLPYTVTNIGVKAFTGCSAIRGVTVPTHLKTMQELFPASYAQIETAEVAEGETTVMDDMFKGCVALRGGATQTDMSMIPNTVTNIGARAFQGCTSLTAFVVPDSVVKIGVSVFQGCSSLWNVTLSRSLTEIPDYAFYGCSLLETMVVPESVTYLGNRFFSGRTDPVPGIVIENALYYLCLNAPNYHSGAYAAIAGNMTTYVLQDSRSWDGRQGSRVLPQSWNGYDITYWTPLRFDVTFDANGGRFDSSGGSTWSEQQIKDMPYALPSTEPVRPGWAFEGWWDAQTGGAEVRYTTPVTATRPHIIYAHWRSLGNKMTVTFNSNGGTVVTPGAQDYVPGQTFGQFPAPTRRGYTFQGWWTEAVNGIRMTEATQVPAADMELFAHWKPITYYVRFHANGGTGTMSDQPFTFDVSGALKTHAFTRTGFAFTGWATTPSGQVRYPENASVVNLEEVQDYIVDLYAVWSGVGYSVRFDSNGGNGIMDNQTIAVDETQNLWPCVFARAGYTFAGWALSPTDAEAKKVTYLDGAAVRNLATSNGAIVPLYAVWETGSRTVRITFDPNGGSVAPNDYWDCVVGTAVEAFPTPTRPGFTFAGWWTERTGGTRMTSIARVTSAQTFYAHWTGNGDVDPGDDSYKVSFNANGGSVSPTSRTVAKNATVGDLPTPVRTGYTFAGWWTAANGGVQVNASTKVTSSVTFYAHWTVNQYTVTFNANGGTGGKSMKQNYGSAIVMPTVTRSGYTFAGWSPAVAATVPANNVTYDALWTKNQAPTPTPTPTPTPEPEPVVVPELYEAVEDVVPTTAASVYDGYLVDARGNVAGSIQVKVGKANVKTGLAAVKATVVVGAAKASLKADGGKVAIAADGPTRIQLVGGEPCEVTLGAEGLSGSYGSYQIDGARNFFTSKDKGEQGAANDLLAKWLGPVNIVWSGGTASVSIGKKGKSKVAVTLADGTKATANAQLLVGEEWLCVPVVVTKKMNLAFTLWLPRNGGATLVEGLPGDVVVGKPGALAANAAFRVGKSAALWQQIPGKAHTGYLPDGMAVTQSGAKWTLPKAGKVQKAKDGTIDSPKLGENPSALKLSYKAKDGSFKGSFKVYADNGGKLKATTVNVTGVVINGVGYGTATIKKVGSVPVSIE